MDWASSAIVTWFFFPIEIAYYYDAAGNYVEPLDSDPRVVELWVGNYPKETSKVRITRFPLGRASRAQCTTAMQCSLLVS